MLDIPHDLEQRKELFSRISPKLKFELKLQDAVSRCCIAVAQNGLRNMTAEQERSLDTLLNIFQAQITSVGLECASGISSAPSYALLLILSRASTSLCPCEYTGHTGFQFMEVSYGAGSHSTLRSRCLRLPSAGIV